MRLVLEAKSPVRLCFAFAGTHRLPGRIRLLLPRIAPFVHCGHSHERVPSCRLRPLLRVTISIPERTAMSNLSPTALPRGGQATDPPERDFLRALGKRSRLQRVQREWSQEQLAEAAGFSRNFRGVVERGDRGIGSQPDAAI
jgi:hypothetical protein